MVPTAQPSSTGVATVPSLQTGPQMTFSLAFPASAPTFSASSVLSRYASIPAAVWGSRAQLLYGAHIFDTTSFVLPASTAASLHPADIPVPPSHVGVVPQPSMWPSPVSSSMSLASMAMQPSPMHYIPMQQHTAMYSSMYPAASTASMPYAAPSTYVAGPMPAPPHWQSYASAGTKRSRSDEGIGARSHMEQASLPAALQPSSSSVSGSTRVRESSRDSMTSRYRGVSLSKSGHWRVQVGYLGQRLSVGHFAVELEAARAYDVCARALHGNTAVLNFPGDVIAMTDVEPGTAQAIRHTLRGAQALHGKTGVPMSTALRRQFALALEDDLAVEDEAVPALGVTLRSATHELRHGGGSDASGLAVEGPVQVAASSQCSSATGNSGHSARTVRTHVQSARSDVGSSARSDVDAASLLMHMVSGVAEPEDEADDVTV